MAIAGWAGSADSFIASTEGEVLEQLRRHHKEHLGMSAAQTQEAAWLEEIDILRTAFIQCIQQSKDAAAWGIILEYELPLEGGRRPDAVVLTGASIAVLEFKQASVPTPAAVDQIEGYARDLADYHAETHGRHVMPVLVLTRAAEVAVDFERVVITGATELPHYLLESASPGTIDIEQWVVAPYEPLPTLVAAARRIFQHKDLPHVKSALAQDIPGTVRLIGELITEADKHHERKLVLVGGVPGSGKTLVGLRLIYERSETEGRGILLSGNGPLVKVLQDALESRVFVRDLHAFIRTYGINGRTPSEHIIVFDEAQRAWDSEFMDHKRGIAHSEPELLVEVGERLPDWAVLVGLVGEGQEIFSGEEAGIGQWRNALLGERAESWTVHAPPSLTEEFAGCRVESHPQLDLTVSLRSRRAIYLHDWVAHLLTGSLALAARIAARMATEKAAFPLYLTRDLDGARKYVRARYVDEPDKRYGLMVAAHAKIPRRYGVDNHFMAMNKLKIGPWFNAPADDPRSCCSLDSPVTEFQVQGLEVDLPIVCWGEDYLWTGTEWSLRPARSQFAQHDSRQLLTNAYRVLLTRGRDGVIVFLPAEGEFDLTEHALLAAGMKPLEEAEGELRDAASGGG